MPLLLRSVGQDRIHDEARLHRHGRAIAAVDALHGAGDETVAHITQTRAAIFRRNGRPEHAERAHFAHDAAVEMLFKISAGDARLQLLLRIGFSRIADEALLVRKLVIEIERILPVERQDGWLGHVHVPACQ